MSRLNNTEVHFLNVPLSLDNEYQLMFSSRESQESYFRGCIVNGFIDSSYQRSEDGFYVRVDLALEELYQINYVMFRNFAFSSNFMYGYVTKLEYKGDECTFVHFKIDSFQSFQFDLTYNQSFVVRQTPIDKTEINTLKDSPDEGTLSITKFEEFFLNGYYLVFCSSDVTKDDPSTSVNLGCKIGKAYVPCQVWYYQDGNLMNADILKWSNAGFGDRIMSACYIPYRNDLLMIEKYADGSLKSINADSNHETYTLNIPNTEYGKELSYPYSYVEILDTITGQTRKYSLDKFADPHNPSFEIQGDVGENPSYRIFPKGYRGNNLGYNEALVVNSITNLPITNNLYANYLKKNENSIPMGFLSTGIGGLISVGSGNMIGGVGALTQVAGEVSKLADSKMLGNQSQNISDSANYRINFDGRIQINYYTMDIYHANMCRNFWKMYGYPVNTLSNLNLPSTTNGYSYIKCINANINGSIPQNYLQEIRTMFNNGVHLWNNPSNFLTW